jgi:hypothetical protein
MTGALLLDPDDCSAIAPEVFRRVWRTSLDQPGFALLRFAREVTSRELRRAMVELAGAFPVAFVPERFGRFDQQVSSKFHRDGAPPASLLVLGYEPTLVRSRFWIADASAAAARAGMGLTEYLAAHNPMFPAGEVLRLSSPNSTSRTANRSSSSRTTVCCRSTGRTRSACCTKRLVRLPTPRDAA